MMTYFGSMIRICEFKKLLNSSEISKFQHGDIFRKIIISKRKLSLCSLCNIFGSKARFSSAYFNQIAEEGQKVSKPIRKNKRIVKPPASQISSRWEQVIQCLLLTNLVFVLQIQFKS